MLQSWFAATCCAILFSFALADDVKWSRQSSSQKRIDDWVPVTDPCPTCKRQIVGDAHHKRQSDDISSLLTPPAFGKPRSLPLSSQDQFLSSFQKGQNLQFPQNRPFALRQTNNFLQQQTNPFLQEQKPQFFSQPPNTPTQGFQFQQSPFFFPQSHFPIPSHPQPQLNFVQPQILNQRPQTIPPQSSIPTNNRLPPKTYPGVVTPVNIGQVQNEEVQLLYVPVETLQKNKLKEFKPFGKQSTEKGNAFSVAPTSQSIVKDTRFPLPADQINQREPKQNVQPYLNPPSSFHFQQIGDNKFLNNFDYRNPFQNFQQPPPQQIQQTFTRNEAPGRFEFVQPSAVPSNEVKQSTSAFPQFNQFAPPPVQQTLPPVQQTLPPAVQQTLVPSTPSVPQFTPQQNPPPHQPPLAVYMERKENSKLTDVLGILKAAKTIPVLDQVEDQSPAVFVGPSSLPPPKGYVKFELPYLSALETNRIERKVENLPFFVAPLNFKPPPGYSKIPFPAPHIGSVVISNSTSFKQAYEKPSPNIKSYNSLEYTTSTPFTANPQNQFSSTSGNFQESFKYNEIPSTTPQTTFKQLTTLQSYETNPPSVSTFDYTLPPKQFETTRPQFSFSEQSFTGTPTFETIPPFDNRQTQFNQFDVNQNRFQTKPPKFENQAQFENKQPKPEVTRPEFDAPFPEFKPNKAQFEGQQITYQFEEALKQQQFPSITPQFNTRYEEEPKVEVPQQVQFENSFISNGNKKPTQSEILLTRDQYFNQQTDVNQNQPPAPPSFQENTFVNQNEFSKPANVQQPAPPSFQENTFVNQNEFSKPANAQQQYDFSTEAPAQPETIQTLEPVVTTTRAPRRRTTTKQPEYKSSTPPASYNPRRNRKPLYRGSPKNGFNVPTTTLATASPEEPSQDISQQYSFNTQANQITNQYEDSLVNKYQTARPEKEFQAASESYYQSELDNTVFPSREQRPTENYPRTEPVETTTYSTQQTPNYSNFQGINQFFNQVIQQENKFIQNEGTTVPIEPVNTFVTKTEPQYYTVQPNIQVTSEPSIQAEITTQTEASPQTSAITNPEEYTKKSIYSEKRHKYRQKYQNNVNTENTPSYETAQNDTSSETEKPLRKNKYRNRQRPGGQRHQYRTSTETAAVDENVPLHFSSLRGQNDQTEAPEIQATRSSTEQPSTRLDVNKYGTFKRRRPGKGYERTTASTETSNVDVETTTPSSPATRSYRQRSRTTSSVSERITRTRARRPSTSTTTEAITASPTEESVRQSENNVDWGSYVNSFNPTEQTINDVSSSLDEQNKVQKPVDESAYSVEKSQSYEITSPASVVESSQNSVTPADQVSHSTNEQNSISQYQSRKFSAKKLSAEVGEPDNSFPVSNSFDSQSTNEKYYGPSGSEDKAIYKDEPQKAVDPTTGKKVGGRKRGQWVRVRVKKPNQEYFQTAESQNVANVGNTIQNPTKPSFSKQPSELLYVQPQVETQFGDLPVNNVKENSDNVYYTPTTERFSTTEDSPSQFDLEKGVSAMIAEFMNSDDESKDNAQETFEINSPKVNDKATVSEEQKSVENASESYDNSYELLEKENLRKPEVHNATESYTETKVDNRNIESENRAVENFNQASIQNSQIVNENIQTQYHENYNEESEQKESQLKEREIKTNVNENSNLGFSNHKYDDKTYESESQTDDNQEKVVEKNSDSQLSVGDSNIKVEESSKISPSTELPEVTTSTPELEGSTEEYDGSVTTEPSELTGTTISKVVGTSTTTEISLETEICYKGRCIKSKKKKPTYQDLFTAN